MYYFFLEYIKLLASMQADLDCYGEEPTLSPRVPLRPANPSFPASSGSSGAPTAVQQGFRSVPNDHNSKNYVFSDALSSPVRLSLQNYHIGEGRYYPSMASSQPSYQPNICQSQNRDSNLFDPTDSSMDMHADNNN